MQNHFRNFIACSFAFVLFGCSQSENRKEKFTVAADSSNGSYISSSAAKEVISEDRKFIRKADLKFKVNDVIQSTYAIESIASKMHGFVTHTQLSSSIENEDRVEMSSDSTLISTTYRVNNSINIRVPNTLLDSALKEISKQIIFLDYRTIDAEDVHLQLAANQLIEKRNEHFQKRIIATAAESNRKEGNLSAEESLLMTQEQKDNARIDNLKINDQINYSNISIAIYQNQNIHHEMISTDKTDSYEPSFLYKLWDAFKEGWHAIIAFTLFIVKKWAFILAAIMLFWGSKKLGIRNK